MIFGNIKRIIKTVLLVAMMVGITHAYYEIRVGSSLDQISEQLEDLAEEQASTQGGDDLISIASYLIEQLLASIQGVFGNSNFSLTNNKYSQHKRS